MKVYTFVETFLIMTAQEFYQTEWPSFSEYSNMTDSEIIELIKKFALLKCEEQRSLCSEYAITGDQDQLIINCETPEM